MTGQIPSDDEAALSLMKQKAKKTIFMKDNNFKGLNPSAS